MSYDTMESQVEELAMYAANFSGPDYNGTGRKLSTAWVKNVWCQQWALETLYVGLVLPAAIDYKREFGSMTQSVDDMWPEAIRWAVTCQMYDHFVDEFKLGNLWGQTDKVE